MYIPVAPAGLEVGGTAVGDPVPVGGLGGSVDGVGGEGLDVVWGGGGVGRSVGGAVKAITRPLTTLLAFFLLSFIFCVPFFDNFEFDKY